MKQVQPEEALACPISSRVDLRDVMKVLVTGASGLIGSHLTPELEARGHEVFRLVRRAHRTGSEVRWDPKALPKLNAFDAVIHLVAVF
jgi:nucleoside-diphosphate-sugar epimerase